MGVLNRPLSTGERCRRVTKVFASCRTKNIPAGIENTGNDCSIGSRRPRRERVAAVELWHAVHGDAVLDAHSFPGQMRSMILATPRASYQERVRPGRPVQLLVDLRPVDVIARIPLLISHRLVIRKTGDMLCTVVNSRQQFIIVVRLLLV